MTEIIQIAARIITFAFFIVVGQFSSFTALKIFLCVIIATNPFKFLVMYKQRLIRKELVARKKELDVHEIDENNYIEITNEQPIAPQTSDNYL